jgi:hypothetical protein
VTEPDQALGRGSDCAEVPVTEPDRVLGRGSECAEVCVTEADQNLSREHTTGPSVINSPLKNSEPDGHVRKDRAGRAKRARPACRLYLLQELSGRSVRCSGSDPESYGTGKRLRGKRRPSRIEQNADGEMSLCRTGWGWANSERRIKRPLLETDMN